MGARHRDYFDVSLFYHVASWATNVHEPLRSEEFNVEASTAFSFTVIGYTNLEARYSHDSIQGHSSNHFRLHTTNYYTGPLIDDRVVRAS